MIAKKVYGYNVPLLAFGSRLTVSQRKGEGEGEGEGVEAGEANRAMTNRKGEYDKRL